MPHRTTKHAPESTPATATTKATGRPAHHEVNEDVSVGGGALPRNLGSQMAETPDTQEAIFSPDGAWDVSEADGEGRRFPTEIELQIEADGLVVIDGPESDLGE